MEDKNEVRELEATAVPAACKRWGHRLKKKLIVAAAVVAALAVLIAVVIPALAPICHYTAAKRLIKGENYTQAYYHLKRSGDYKDTAELLEDFVVEFGTYLFFQYGGLQSRKEYERDKYGNATSGFTYDSAGEQKSSFQHIMEYASDGRLLSRVSYHDGKQDMDYKYAYDQNGNLTESIIYRSTDGEELDKKTYEYDEEGNRISYTFYNHNGELLYRWEYDKNGNTTKQIEYGDGGSPVWITTYEHDKDGKQTGSVRRSAEGKVNIRTEQEYDKKGNLVKSSRYNAREELVSSVEYTYDRAGNRTSMTGYDAYGEIKKKKRINMTEGATR